MKNILKILTITALAVALPAQAVVFNLNFDSMIVAEPVVLPSTSSTNDAIPTQPIQPLDNIVLPNTTLNLKPLSEIQQEFKTFDLKLMSQYELQIYNDLEKQLNFALQPKTFALDENLFNKTIVQYRDDRMMEIKRQYGNSVGSINDEMQVLDSELDEFSFTLREQLQARAVLMEKEQEQLILNLQLSLADFKIFYQFKEADAAVRSGSLTESPVVSTMDTKLTAASDTYKEVEEKQSDALTAISVAKTDVADDSLKSTYLTDVEMQIKTDTETINVMLDDLQMQREKIIALSNDISLLSAPLTLTDTVAPTADDQLVADEQSALLASKELELQTELETYYQMQQETQLLLNTSLTNLNTFTLN